MGLRHHLRWSVALAFGAALPAVAQDTDRTSECLKTIVVMGGQVPKDPAKSCDVLKVRVYAAAQEKMTKVKPDVPVSAIQPVPQAGDSPGPLGQSTAVPPVTPTGLAGGTVGVSGTGTGTRIVTVLSINPFAIAPNSAETLSWATRTADLTVALPIPTQSTSLVPGTTSSFEYVGVRFRINAFAWLNGSTAYKNALAKYGEYINQSSQYLEAISNSIDTAKDIPRCASAIANANTASIQDSCGGAVGTTALAAAHDALGPAMRAASWEADRQYLGLDLRGDFGDPTLSGKAEARQTSLLGALGYGIRLGRPSNSAMFRFRVGAAYGQLNSDPTGIFSVDYGVGLEWGAIGNVQALRFNVGLEGRRSNTRDVLVDTNFNDLKLGVSVPLSNGTAVSLGFSVPLGASNPHTPVLTMSGDWALLLADFKAAANAQ